MTRKRQRPSLGEQIGKRLAEQHGFKWAIDPANFRVVRDQGAIRQSIIDGMDYRIWWLSDGAEHPTATICNHLGEKITTSVTIESAIPASKLVRQKEPWRVNEWVFSSFEIA